MPKRKTNFNKKIFAILLEAARGDRSVRRFASEAGISYIQMRKLLLCEQENPPGMKLITKIAESSEGRVDLEELLFAVDKDSNSIEVNTEISPREKLLLNNYANLSSKQQKTVDDFVDFLLRYKK